MAKESDMNYYDAIIVGAGTAGLGVAGLLQDKGLKTMVIEKSKILGGRNKTSERPGGWKVDFGTHCVVSGTRSACADLLKKLGKEIPWSRNIDGFLVYEDGLWKPMMEYLDLSAADKENLLSFQNWIRSLGAEEIEAFDTVSLTQLLAQKVASAKVAEFMKIVAMCYTTLTDSDIISAGEFADIYREQLRLGTTNDSPFSEIRMPLGGCVTMMRAMAEAYTERGGVIQTGMPVRHVKVEKGKHTEVITDSGIQQAPVVVIAAPIWDMVEFLPMSEIAPLAPEWAARMPGLVMETSASFGFTIGTRIPLFTSPSYLTAWRLPDVELPLQVLGHSLFDDTIAPPGHMIAIIGACCTPAQALDQAFREKTLSAFWEFLKKTFPALEENLVWKTDGYIVGIDGLSRSPGMTGRYRPPVHLAEIPGLYFAGDCYTGRGIGMNSAANSAMICAEKILATFGK